MIVALNITSEAGDDYLLLYNDRSVDQIREELWGEGSYYGCNINYAVLECTSAEEEELQKAIEEIEQESWDWHWG